MKRGRKIVSRGPIDRIITKLISLVFLDKFYGDKRDYLCSDFNAYYSHATGVIMCRKHLNGTDAKSEVDRHIQWLHGILPASNELNVLIETIDKACDGTSQDRCVWSRRNVIRKTSAWVEANASQ